MTSIYIIPAVVAFFATAYLLFLLNKKEGSSKVLFTMVLVFLAHHICETLGFIEFIKNSPHVIYQLKVYYIVTFWALIYIFMYALEISKVTIKHINVILYGLGAVITALISYNDTIIAGANSLGYIMTAQKGAYYFIFQITSLLLLSTLIGILFHTYKKTTNTVTQTQCIYMLIAFSPLLLTVLGVMLLMTLGFEINAAVVIPISSTLFLMILLKSEAEHKLTDLRRFMPFSPERQTSQEIMELYTSYTQNEISYRDCMAKIERILVMDKYNKSGNNASMTAKLMGMPRSSLYSIFNRLNIDIKDQ